MNNKDDLTNIIKDMAMEYLKPKYPIYRLEYIHSEANEDSEESTICITKVRSVVVEVIDDANKDASYYNPHTPGGVIFQGDFMRDGRIDTTLLPVLLDKKGTVMRDSSYQHTWVFTKIERLG